MRKTDDMRVCLFCGKELIGRSDKKYCDDSCRNNHHNQKNRYSDDVVKHINMILSHNRDILMSLNKRRKSKVNKQLLIDFDFDFDMITNIYKTKQGNEYRVIYDYAYRFLNENDVFLLKMKW